MPKNYSFILTYRYDESLTIFEKTLNLLQKNISTFQFRFYFNDFYSRNKKYFEKTVRTFSSINSS